VLARSQESAPPNKRRLIPWCATGQERFPCNNFTYYFTLFPKCFSPFDHSTCALSVSGRYLALEGIYLPLRAAFPNYSTRRRRFTQAGTLRLTGLSPSVAPRSRGLRRDTSTRILPYRLQLGPCGQISNLSFCRFTRRYWGNPCWFLFLRLLICLSSAGLPTRSEVNISRPVGACVGGFTAGASAQYPGSSSTVSLLCSGPDPRAAQCLWEPRGRSP
jgi:hypothetical protein